MKKISPMRMVFIIGYYSIVANFAHPIEPTIYTSLGFHDYMFGVAFACMALTNFAFSPFWSKMCDKYGCAKMMGYSSFAYAGAQLLFTYCTSEIGIALARLLAGVFISTISVGQLIYIMQHSPREKAGQNLMYNATASAVMSPVGYLIGGFLGDVSIKLCMWAQVIGLLVLGLMYLLLLKDEVKEPAEGAASIWRDVNPLKSFGEIRPYMNRFLVVFFLLSAVTMFASTCYEQSFNYLIKAEFGFPASYNGMLKALVGVIALIANFTICNWLLHHTDAKCSTIYVLGVQTMISVGVALITDLVPFIIINVFFFGLNAVYLPLLQVTLTEASDEKSNSIFVGMFNAVRSIGMIAGSLIAGFLYAFSYQLPFVLTAALFAVSVALAVVNYRQSQKGKVSAAAN